MTSNEYQQACCKTENKDVESIKARLREPEAVAELYHFLKTVSEMSRRWDAFKKYCYYGKESGNIYPVDVFPTKDEVNMAVVTLNEDKNSRLIHAVLGAATEVGELCELLQSNIFNNKIVTQTDWVKEFGDLSWYQALGCDAIPCELEQVMKINIDKLKKRYPQLFTEKDAQNHDSQ